LNPITRSWLVFSAVTTIVSQLEKPLELWYRPSERPQTTLPLGPYLQDAGGILSPLAEETSPDPPSAILRRLGPYGSPSATYQSGHSDQRVHRDARRGPASPLLGRPAPSVRPALASASQHSDCRPILRHCSPVALRHAAGERLSRASASQASPRRAGRSPASLLIRAEP